MNASFASRSLVVAVLALLVLLGSGHAIGSAEADGGAADAPGPAGEVDLAGDVNCNGVVTSLDALLMLQALAGLSDGLPCPWFADLDGDCFMTTIDAALILQIGAEIIPIRPAVPCVASATTVTSTSTATSTRSTPR